MRSFIAMGLAVSFLTGASLFWNEGDMAAVRAEAVDFNRTAYVNR